LGGGPIYDVVEIVQFYQPNVQCMRSAGHLSNDGCHRSNACIFKMVSSSAIINSKITNENNTK